jgi:hypothetical protein
MESLAVVVVVVEAPLRTMYKTAVVVEQDLAGEAVAAAIIGIQEMLVP